MEYSKVAIFSIQTIQREQGVKYLQALYESGYKLSETGYWLIIGYIQIGLYTNARDLLTTIVRSNPSDEKYAALLEIYKEEIKKTGWKGIGIIVGGVVLGLLGTSLLIYWYKQSKTLPTTKEWVVSNLYSNPSTNISTTTSNHNNSTPATWRGSSGTSSSSSGSSYRRY